MKKTKLTNKPIKINSLKVVNAFIEIPRGKSNKYEYDHTGHFFRLDRVLHSSVYYPTEYGFIPDTLAKDDDPLDIMVITSFPTFPGCVIPSKVIGALELVDSGTQDTKIIAINSRDPREKHIETLKDLVPHFKKEIEEFWLNYSRLEPQKNIKIQKWVNKKTAYKIIQEAMERYQKHDG